MQSQVQTTAQQPSDTLAIHIYEGVKNNSFVYYEDDGESYNYEHGAYYKRLIGYDAAKQVITFNKPEGQLVSKFHYLKLIMHGFSGAIKMDGKGLDMQSGLFPILTPISRFDPQGSGSSAEGANVKTIVIKNNSNKFSISY